MALGGGQRLCCGRCGEIVPESRYSYGVPATPGSPGRFVVTGSTVQRIPIFRHGGPTGCHPLPDGVVEQVVPTGHTEGRVAADPGRPWALGRSEYDHGCDSCRDISLRRRT